MIRNMKKIFLILCVLLCVGCGAGTSTPVQIQNPDFYFSAGPYQITGMVPQNMQNLLAERDQQRLLLLDGVATAQVLMLRGKGNLDQKIFELGQQQFYYLEPQPARGERKIFRGQRETDSPVYMIEYQTYPIPNSQFFLWVMCQYPAQNFAVCDDFWANMSVITP